MVQSPAPVTASLTRTGVGTRAGNAGKPGRLAGWAHRDIDGAREVTLGLILATWLLWFAGGCSMTGSSSSDVQVQRLPEVYLAAPRELSKAVLPQYVIEPPDVLTIEAINPVPRSPYRLKVLDLLTINVAGTLPESPVAGVYPIEPGGVVKLGIPYGAVAVAGMTVSEAEEAAAATLEPVRPYTGSLGGTRGIGCFAASPRRLYRRSGRHGHPWKLWRRARRWPNVARGQDAHRSTPVLNSWKILPSPFRSPRTTARCIT